MPAVTFPLNSTPTISVVDVEALRERMPVAFTLLLKITFIPALAVILLKLLIAAPKLIVPLEITVKSLVAPFTVSVNLTFPPFVLNIVVPSSSSVLSKEISALAYILKAPIFEPTAPVTSNAPILAESVPTFNV